MRRILWAAGKLLLPDTFSRSASLPPRDRQNFGESAMAVSQALLTVVLMDVSVAEVLHIVAEAIHLAGPEQDQFLANRCGDDAMLRDALRQLLTKIGSERTSHADRQSSGTAWSPDTLLPERITPGDQEVMTRDGNLLTLSEVESSMVGEVCQRLIDAWDVRHLSRFEIAHSL